MWSCCQTIVISSNQRDYTCIYLLNWIYLESWLYLFLYLLWNVTKSAVTLLNLFFCTKSIFLLPRPWIKYFSWFHYLINLFGWHIRNLPVTTLNTFWLCIDFIGLLQVSGVLIPDKQMLFFFYYWSYYWYPCLPVCRCFPRAVWSYCFQDPLPIFKYGRCDHVK